MSSMYGGQDPDKCALCQELLPPPGEAWLFEREEYCSEQCVRKAGGRLI